jgi:hypothetical protein
MRTVFDSDGREGAAARAADIVAEATSGLRGDPSIGA